MVKVWVSSPLPRGAGAGHPNGADRCTADRPQPPCAVPTSPLATVLQPWRRGGVGVAPFAHSPRGAWACVGGPGSGPGGSERRACVADSIPMAQGHRGRGGARVGGVGADFGSAPPRAAACASGGLGYREGESRGGARSFCDRRGWVRCAAPPIFRASGAREVALILLSYVYIPKKVRLIARSPRE